MGITNILKFHGQIPEVPGARYTENLGFERVYPLVDCILPEYCYVSTFLEVLVSPFQRRQQQFFSSG
jgi:hypothetical protein